MKFDDIIWFNLYAGVERVKQSSRQYAFFMESAPIKYTIHRECNLTQVGGLLDSKEYGND